MRPKIIIYYTLLILSFINCTSAQKNSTTPKSETTGYYFPPQWDEQESVWLGWPVSKSVQQLHLQMAKAVHPYVGITILSRSDSLLKIAFTQLHAAGIDTHRVNGYVQYIPNLFIRDAGPRFLKNEKGELAIADFAWNNFGYPPEFENVQNSNQRGVVDNDLGKQMGWRMISTPIVAEGGGLDVSNHVMISFKETALQRNPGRTIEEIEKEYLRMYGKQKMIWLNKMPVMDKVASGPKAGNYFGYGANGHIDEFARFVNDSTILISQIDSTEKDLDPVSKTDYGIMKENLEILNRATDINGKPYKIIIVPTPSYSHYAEKRMVTDSLRNTTNGKILFKNLQNGEEIFWLPAVSYCNFFITNGVVLQAKYWQEGLPESERRKDERALQILQTVFPERKIIQLNPMALNRNGGGMNCGTQQQPKSN
ncbi:MAG: agmatine deiminase family protein [Chitinophagaceae bacterium]